LRSKLEIKNRYWILNKFEENPNSEIRLTGYLNLNQKSNWVTFTQIENDSGERIAGHLNFPKHKVRELYHRFEKYNHKKFILKGKPGFYVSKGTKRGCILLNHVDLQTR
tara:strand:- start:525 stop:851 length:327 start_codon:yes stop_codon:yes gene_type:complete